LVYSICKHFAFGPESKIYLGLILLLFLIAVQQCLIVMILLVMSLLYVLNQNYGLPILTPHALIYPHWPIYYYNIQFLTTTNALI